MLVLIEQVIICTLPARLLFPFYFHGCMLALSCSKSIVLVPFILLVFNVSSVSNFVVSLSIVA